MEKARTTLDFLAEKYPQLISQAQMAEIFQRSKNRTRVLLSSGDLPFKPITGRPLLYRLGDIADFIDGKIPGKASPKRGRPVGSRIRSKNNPDFLPQS